MSIILRLQNKNNKVLLVTNYYKYTLSKKNYKYTIKNINVWVGATFYTVTDIAKFKNFISLHTFPNFKIAPINITTIQYPETASLKYRNFFTQSSANNNCLENYDISWFFIKDPKKKGLLAFPTNLARIDSLILCSLKPWLLSPPKDSPKKRKKNHKVKG